MEAVKQAIASQHGICYDNDNQISVPALRQQPGTGSRRGNLPMQDHSSIPLGFCGCGCGQRTKLASHTRTKDKIYKGHPLRFIQFHNSHFAKPATDRFWKRVSKSSDPNGCWLWTGSVDVHGYGAIYDASKDIFRTGRCVKTHRLSYEIANGPIPDGLFVCHHCDTPSCVNPAHLFLGTREDNTQDMVRKNRQRAPQGEVHWCAKLDDETVRTIRAEFDSGSASLYDLTAKYDVCYSNIRQIVRRITWKHLA